MLGHYIVCSSIYGFNYPFGIFKVLVIVLSVLRRFTVSDFLFVFFKLLNLYLFVLPRLAASDYPLGIFKLLAIVVSVLRVTASDY